MPSRLLQPLPPPPTPPPVPAKNHWHIYLAVTVASAAAATAGMLLLLLLLVLYLRRRRRQHPTLPFSPPAAPARPLRRYSRRELRRATGGFHPSRLLGRGAASPVFLATFSDASLAAVKTCSSPHELHLLASLPDSPRLVSLLGYSSSGADHPLLLVFEYMPHGSLQGALFGDARDGRFLDWTKRLAVVRDVARALAFLHAECQPPVVHGDLKPSNILLDANMEARVADFGVAKALQGAAPMSVIAGSCGYIAPEYTYTLQVDEKSDVYSFGVVLLEILTGRRAVEAEYGEGSNIVDWVRRKVAGGDGGLHDVMDAAVWADQSREARDEMVLVLRVALLCTSRCPQDRPSMRDVLSMLQEAKPNRKPVANKHVQ